MNDAVLLKGRTMKIYTTQLTELDLSGAALTGKVIQIPVDVYRPNLTLNVKRDRVALIQRQMADFDPQRDAILLVGDPINIGLVFHCAANMAKEAGVGHLLTLRWDRLRDTYQHIEVAL